MHTKATGIAKSAHVGRRRISDVKPCTCDSDEGGAMAGRHREYSDEEQCAHAVWCCLYTGFPSHFTPPWSGAYTGTARFSRPRAEPALRVGHARKLTLVGFLSGNAAFNPVKSLMAIKCCACPATPRTYGS